MQAGQKSWRGIFAIPVTPFLPDGAIDYESLERQVEFCIGAGAAGLVYPGVVSEFFTLSITERKSVTGALITAAAGRVPVIVGVSGPSTPLAVDLAQHAQEIGADGVMATLPYVDHFFAPSDEFVLNHFEAIARAARLPVIMQNARMGHTVGFGLLRRVVESNPGVQYLKQETSPCTHELSAAMTAVGEHVDGIFGGLGSIYLLNELDRGSSGSMPAPAFIDSITQAFTRYETGDRAGARSILSPLAPLFTLELLYNVGVIKEILYRRGIISHTTCRAPSPVMDATDHRELDELLDAAEVGSAVGAGVTRR